MFDEHSYAVTAMSFSPDGRMFVSGDGAGKVVFWWTDAEQSNRYLADDARFDRRASQLVVRLFHQLGSKDEVLARIAETENLEEQIRTRANEIVENWTIAPEVELAMRAHQSEAAGFAEKAFEDYGRILELNPTHEVAIAARIRLGLDLSRWDELDKLFAALIAKSPDDDMLWFKRAVVLVERGDRRAYDALFDQMKKHATLQAGARGLRNLAKIACFYPPTTEQADEALRWAKKAFEKQSDHLGWPQLVLGLAYLRSGSHELAVKELTAAMSVTKDLILRAIAQALLAIAYHEMKQPEMARRSFEEAKQTRVTLSLASGPTNWHDILFARQVLKQAESRLAEAE